MYYERCYVMATNLERLLVIPLQDCAFSSVRVPRAPRSKFWSADRESELLRWRTIDCLLSCWLWGFDEIVRKLFQAHLSANAGKRNMGKVPLNQVPAWFVGIHFISVQFGSYSTVFVNTILMWFIFFSLVCFRDCNSFTIPSKNFPTWPLYIFW